MLTARYELSRQLALGREQHERDAEDRVGARGEAGDRAVGGCHAILGGKPEVYLGTLGATYPVALLCTDVLGPASELVKIV